MNCRTLARGFLLGFAVSLSGCGTFVTGLASQSGSAAGAAAGKTAPPAALDKIVDMDTPANRERVARIVRSETAQDASRTLGNGIGKGLIDELFAVGSGAVRKQFADLAPSDTQPAATPSAGTQPADTQSGNNASTRPSLNLGNARLERIFQNQIDPMIAEIARTFVYEGIKAGTGPEAQNGARAITRATSDGAMQGAIDALKEHGPVLKDVIVNQFGPAVGEALRQQITPWVQELRRQNFRGDIHAVLQEELAPTARQLWDQGAKDTLLIPTQPDIAPAVVTNSRNLSKGAGFGSHDAMIELGVLNSAGNFTLHLKLALWGGVVIAVLIGIAAAASIVLLVMMIVRMWRNPARSKG